MHELSIDDIKNMEVELLIELDDFCKKNNISYFLAYGTLLGAIRHHGFIPWDDDIDILMPRKDYEVFLNTFCSNVSAVINYGTNGYVYPFAKLFLKNTILKENIKGKSCFGVYIDLFPMDGLPCKKQVRHLKKIYFLKRAIKHKYSLVKHKSLFKRAGLFLIKIFLVPFSYKFLSNMINKKSKKYSFEEKEDVANNVWGYEFKNFKRSWFSSYVLVEFENHYFRAPVGYDDFLRANYGDYMIPPSMEKRVLAHGFKAYLLSQENKEDKK